MDWTQIESKSYWTVFVVTFLLISFWESRRPNRPWIVPTARRWSTHGILLLLGAFISSMILGLSPAMAAVAVSGNTLGLLNQTWVPFWIRLICTILLLDFVKYGVHRILHTVPILWRVHRMHHSDPDFDLSTGARVHPVEFILVQSAIIGTILLLAPPPAAVLAALLFSTFLSFFGHANASLPSRVERALRPWLITPDLHRIHHSEKVHEQFRNYGEIVPWWDKLLGTYQPQPEGNLVVGLRGYQTVDSMRPGTLLTMSFQEERKQ